MKFDRIAYEVLKIVVASFAEAWIEIVAELLAYEDTFVASFAEAWIEIWVSHSWYLLIPVASFAEAWIEIICRS